MHAQFETIHPFTDGNGRTGRALIHAMLCRREPTRNVAVRLSAGLLADTRGYFDTRTEYRDGDRAGWRDRVRARRGAAVWRLADLLLRQPIIDAPHAAGELGMAAGNVQRVIAPLVEAGVLDEFTGFERNRMWQAREVLAALDAFATRAGRRTF